MSELHTIQDLNLELYIEGEREDTLLDSTMFYCSPKLGNQCELNTEGGCVVDFGIYFGTADTREPVFCPAHYFTGGGYIIKPTK